MEKKRNLPPESSQVVEPPLKEQKSEAEQKRRVSVAMAEPVQDLLKLLKKEEIVTLLINASVTDPGLEQTIRELAMEKKRNPPPESSQVVEPPLKEEQESLPVQEEKEGDQAFKQSSTSTFGKHQKTQALITPSTSFGGSLRFDSTVPTSVRKHMEAIWKRFGSEAMQKAQQPYSKCKTSSFGSFPIGDPIRKPFSILSYPAITEEDGGTSGRTAKLERYESCFAIAGANYCVIAADFTCGQTKKISKLSEKSVMASCGSQADVKALQEALSAKNLMYEREHNKPMSCPEMHRLFCDFLKSRPKYVFIVLGGLDSEGKGCVFQHFGPCSGATMAPEVGQPGSRLIELPILKYKLPAEDVIARMSETEAVDLAKNVFKSATNTGDKLEIVVINAGGLCYDSVDLRKDCP